MLSYQHAYHAGGPADVTKHTLWAELIAALTNKPKPLYVYETHAGRGLYPVAGPETSKTPEYQSALARIFPAHSNTLYLKATAALNPPGTLQTIPGSPAVANHLLRPDTDHLHLAEAHPSEFAYLEANLGGRKHIHLHAEDGHRHIPALIRSGQRTLVLIDPSYEVKAEYLQTVETVKAILAKNPQATIMVWYPMLPAKLHQQLIDGLKALQVSATWLGQSVWNKVEMPGMYGSGQVILNMPYQASGKLEDKLAAHLRKLSPALKQTRADVTTTLLVPRT